MMFDNAKELVGYLYRYYLVGSNPTASNTHRKNEAWGKRAAARVLRRLCECANDIFVAAGDSQEQDGFLFWAEPGIISFRPDGLFSKLEITGLNQATVERIFYSGRRGQCIFDVTTRLVAEQAFTDFQDKKLIELSDYATEKDLQWITTCLGPDAETLRYKGCVIVGYHLGQVWIGLGSEDVIPNLQRSANTGPARKRRSEPVTFGAKERVTYLQTCLKRSTEGGGEEPEPATIWPTLTTLCFGRDDHIRALDDAWRNRRGLIFWLHGSPGEGKTAILRRWHDESATEYVGKERCLAYSFYKQGVADHRIATTGPCFDALAAHLGRRLVGRSEDDRLQELARIISEKPTIIVLDGIEVLQASADDNGIAPFRDTTITRFLSCLAGSDTQILVIVSSRARPRHGTTDRDLSADWIAVEIPLEPLHATDARRLLYKLATKNDGQPASPLLEKYDALVEALNRNALALTVLGSYIDHDHHGNINAIAPRDLRLDRTTKHGAHALRVLDRILDEYQQDSKKEDLVAVLRLLGLFQQSVEYEKLVNVIAHLKKLKIRCPVTPASLNDCLSRLAARRLLVAGPETIETHPLLRAGYAKSLQGWPEAMHEAHAALFKVYTGIAPQPNTPREIRDLFVGIHHAIASNKRNLIQKAFRTIYWERCQRNTAWSRRNFAFHDLGMVSEGFVALLDFFEDISDEKPLAMKASLGLGLGDQARLMSDMAVYLRARGALKHAVALMTRASKTSWRLASAIQAPANGIREMLEAVMNDESASEIHLLRLEGQDAVDSAKQACQRFEEIESTLRPAHYELDSTLEMDMVRRRISVYVAHADVMQHFGSVEDCIQAGTEFVESYKLFRSKLFKKGKQERQEEQVYYPVRPLFWFGYRLDQHEAPQKVWDDIDALAKTSSDSTIAIKPPYSYWGVLACYAAEAQRLLGNVDHARALAGIAIENLHLANVEYHKPRGWLTAARISADALALSVHTKQGEIDYREALTHLNRISCLHDEIQLRLYEVEGLLVRSKLEHLRDNHTAARDTWRKALTLSKEHGYTRGLRLCNEFAY